MADQDSTAAGPPKSDGPKSSDTSAKAQDAAWEAAQGGSLAEQRARDEAKEYADWVATGPIPIGGVVAFTRGHAVPQSHIDKYGLDRREGSDGPLVVRRSTKAGKDLLESIAAEQRGE